MKQTKSIISRRLAPISLAVCAALALSACGTSGTAAAFSAASSMSSASSAADSPVSTDSTVLYEYPAEALDSSAEGAESLVLSGDSVTIEKTGIYLVSGEISGGSLLIDVDKEDSVHLILNGVSITSNDGPAIWAKHGVLTVTLAEGSENTLTDSATYSMEAEENAPTAALFCKDNLYLNGSGSLTVNANYKDGIASKDILAVTGGNITVNSADDALVGHDGFAMNGGSINLTAGDDGVKASGSNEGEGFVQLDGGLLNINAGDDGIHAENVLLITGGEINVLTSYEGLEATEVCIEGGNISVTSSDDGLNAAGGTDTLNGQTDSFARSTGSMEISGGSITVNAGGDGLDSNGSLTISGGDITVYGPSGSGNCALDYDSACTVTGGTLVALGSSAMAQMPSADSTQASLMVTYTGNQAAGTVLRLLDDSGNEILTVTAEKEFSSAVFSAPELTGGESYTVLCGEISTTAILSSDSALTAVAQDGTATSTGGMGMGGGRGNMGVGMNGREGMDGERGNRFDGTTPENAPDESLPQDKMQGDKFRTRTEPDGSTKNGTDSPRPLTES